VIEQAGLLAFWKAEVFSLVNFGPLPEMIPFPAATKSMCWISDQVVLCQRI
jgi:hypothetical protein